MSKTHQIKWTERASVDRNTRRHLPQLISWYFDFGRALLAQDIAPSDLHRLRLATKRVRYTLELFQDRYGPGLETRMNQLRHVQQLLGELNDVVAARQLLAGRIPGRNHQRLVEKSLADRLAAKLGEFRTYWAQVFDAPDQERRWTHYLGRAARAPRRRA